MAIVAVGGLMRMARSDATGTRSMNILFMPRMHNLFGHYLTELLASHGGADPLHFRIQDAG